MKHLVTLFAALLLGPLAALHAQQAPRWVLPEVDAPRVQRVLLESEAAGRQVSCHVFMPGGYETEKDRRFPVLYWLHGTGGGLPGIPRLSEFFDRAMQEGKIPPMLVVFPNGLAGSMWCDSKDATAPIETVLIKELIPHVDATFRTVAARHGRVIEGFSMGGFGAARLGFKYPQLFGAVSILAGGPLDLDFAGPRAIANPAERERILKEAFGGDLDSYRAQHPITIAEQQADAVRGKEIVRIAVGSRDSSGPLNRAYSEHLTKLKIDHTFSIVPEAGHDTLALLQGLGEANWGFYRKAFASFQDQTTTTAPWILPEPETPRMQRVLFESEAAGENVSCYVFTPQPYDADQERRFPVLYWLHGSGGSSPGAAAQLARRYAEAMRAGKIPPMILVFPNGLPRGMWCDWEDGSVKLETMLIEELIPHIDGSFRTQAAREGRIIDGFSMGGYGAARLGFKHPHLFAAVSLLGAGPLQAELTETPRAGPRERELLLSTVYGGDMAYYRELSPWHIVEQNAENLRAGLLIRQIVGDRDETLGANREFKQHLDALKIPHSYRQLRDIPHDPNLVFDTLGEDNWEFYRAALAQDKPLSPGVHPRTITVGDLQRSYLLHVPAGAAAGKALPLVIMLHGGGGKAESTAHETGWSVKADADGFMVAYPDAIAADPSKPAAFRGNPQTWNDGSGRFKKDGGEVDDVAFLGAMMDDIATCVALDEKRIYLTGFSNGASMAFVAGMELSERVAALAPVAGACWLPEVKLKRGVPMCYVTGTADPLNPLNGGPLRLGLGGKDKPPVLDSILKWVKALDAPVEPAATRERDGVRTVRYGPGRDGAGVVFVAIEGQGHVWPGGKNLLPEVLVGKETGRLKAVDVIWDFFKAIQPSASPSSPQP